MPIENVREPVPRTVAEAVAGRLREQIATGDLAPGTRLRLVETAARLGVSTTPVRDALAMLDRQGLVVSVPQRGVVVYRPTIEELEEAYDIRRSLESLATERAAARIDDTTVTRLEVLIEAMAGLSIADVDRYIELNARFHATIYARAGRPKLAAMIAELRQATVVYLRMFAAAQPSAADTQREHEAIFDALRRRRPAAAARAMHRHLTHTVEVVSEGLAHLAVAGRERREDVT